ncbi:MAG: response regulator transcription factor [Rubrobacteridae bacterium]|nr:response regulator transcription factor [Rubrobacteridae bacterium]
MAEVKVLIVESHPLMQVGIRNTLEQAGDIRIVGEASTGETAIELAYSAVPDVVIMDTWLPDMDGITAMKHIMSRSCEARVLMFSGFDDEHYVIMALENGAAGYLLKNIDAVELTKSVKLAAEGMSPISPQLACKLLPFSRRRSDAGNRLTPREIEVWRLLSSGASNAEISKNLFVSESTVKFHVRNIFHKLGVKNRVEAAQIAYKTTVA